MRLFVFFDLPMETSADRRHYARFRKCLQKSGFMMLQKSVYCKLLLNASQADSTIKNLESEKPPKGIVHILTVTERQFLKMESLVGKTESSVIHSDERTLIL